MNGNYILYCKKCNKPCSETMRVMDGFDRPVLFLEIECHCGTKNHVVRSFEISLEHLDNLYELRRKAGL